MPAQSSSERAFYAQREYESQWIRSRHRHKAIIAALTHAPSKRSIKSQGRGVGNTADKRGGIVDMRFRRTIKGAEWI